MDTQEITLNFAPKSKGSTNGKWTVFAGEKPLYCDTFDGAKRKPRDAFIKELTERCEGIEAHKIEEMILQEVHTVPLDKDEECNEPLAKSKIELERTEPRLRQLAEQFLKSPDLIERIIDDAHELGIAGEEELIVALYLLGTSRLLEKPVAAVVMGQSSAGKSYLCDTVAKLFPDEVVLRAHRITPRALQNMPPGSLKHRFIAAGERSRQQDDAAAETTRALREMISEGNLSALVSAPQRSGPQSTVHIQQEGPISYVESTTMGVRQIFDEDRTRFLLLCSNETREQTQAIIHKLAQNACAKAEPDKPDSIIALHHTAQRILQPLSVVIPFARKLASCLPDERVETRRTFGHLISLIQAVALLFQKQREQDQHSSIIATICDYEVVRRYLVKPLATALGEMLTPGAEEALDVASGMGEFTVQDLTAKLPGKPSENTVRSRIKELTAAGQVRITEQGSGPKAAKYEVVEDGPPLHGLALPDLNPNDKEVLGGTNLKLVEDKL